MSPVRPRHSSVAISSGVRSLPRTASEKPCVGEGSTWRGILRLGSAQHRPAGTELFRQGNPPRDVYCIDTGVVKLLHERTDGRAAIVGVRSSMRILGAAAALAGSPHIFSALTVTDCTLYWLPSTTFLKLTRNSKRLAWFVNVLHARESLEELEFVANLNAMMAKERLEWLLTRLRSELLCSASDPDAPVQLPLRDWELAQLAAISPQWLCGLMRALACEGTLERRGHRWFICESDKISEQPSRPRSSSS